MKYKVVVPFFAILISYMVGCADNIIYFSNSINSNELVSSINPFDKFGDPNWVQTTPGNIVGKYAPIQNVPLQKEFKGTTYTYAWAEEFNGNSLNKEVWQNDFYTYTSDKLLYKAMNIIIDNGLLTILGKNESGFYTTAKIDTRNKMYFHYGYIEAMIDFPSFQGAWPAVMLLGQNRDSIGWPECGEIDFVTAKDDDDKVDSVLYYGLPKQQTKIGTYSFDTPNERNGWHHYEMIWNEKNIITYVDSIEMGIIDISLSKFSAFHQDFFFFINFFIDVSMDFIALDNAQELKIDYIRVYQQYNLI